MRIGNPRIAFCLAFLSASAGGQARTGIINVGDASIHFELSGHGETVVFIHGWANTLAIWDDQTPEFSQRYQVLRYDRRGFGKSTGFADVSAAPDDLRILLDSLAIASEVRGWLVGGLRCSDAIRVHVPRANPRARAIKWPAARGNAWCTNFRTESPAAR